MRPNPVKSGLRLLAATSALVVVFAGSAYAIDGNAVAARLKAVYTEQGGVLEYSNVETNGTTVVLKDAKVSTTGIKETFNAGDVTLSDVSDVSGGGFKVGSLTVPDVSFSPEGEDKGTIKLEGIAFEGITLPAEGATEPLAKFLQYEKAEIKHVAFNAKGKDVFVADALTATISPLTETSPVAFTTNVESFKADLSEVEDPKTKEALTALGYETLTGKIDMNGTWNVADGRLNIEKMDFITDDAGTLGVKLDISGYTLDFIKGLQEATKNMEGKPDDAQGMAMLGLMQQLSFTGASIRFEDDSVTYKALDYVAKQQNAKREDLINQAKAIVPMAAAQLGDAEFAQTLGTAVGEYLDDPKTLEIKAAPPKSVPFAIIAAGGMADPKSLLKTLGVTVIANQ
ncbi:hypothetical protein QFZ34_003927 [Phyllobacterium ifriqiyense]|uniref:DUF945 domain-containing protein n=1 Tax=Phyllobacterium ifriqiyense TaxID=314238 RepID=A0ABU0SDF0_9HYPH|nr:hypothetical protein [Phyllobacterium ifriqiyense]MDQ0998745.1 hypothetical protein [Phyllobacterium ifriqiyense]